MSAVFLSAGVPPSPDRRGYDTADAYLIREAVSSFIEVVLGRRLIVWGGQPAITPMIWAAAESLRIPYDQCVVLFRSNFFREHFRPDDEKFARVITTLEVPGDRDRSLTAMRQAMLDSTEFESAVFIGGSDGLFEELSIFRARWPLAKVVALPAPGGVASEIYDELEAYHDLNGAIDFVPKLYRHLEIRPSEPRRPRIEGLRA